MDVSKMSITELKATAYDILAGIEIGQANLRKVNSLIVQKQEADNGQVKTIGNIGSPEAEAKDKDSKSGTGKSKP